LYKRPTFPSYKKYLRAGGAYKIFTDRVSEELGDILWYLANIAAKPFSQCAFRAPF